MQKERFTLENLNKATGNLVAHLGIEFLEVTPQKLVAKMPVDERTVQPLGILHGGASVVLAETLGSIGATLNVSDSQICVGLEINANHIKSAREGYVIGTATPIHLGRSTHVWEIRITSEDYEKLICISRITMSILEKKK
jgi:1,4-dihydroxy-2-naphthoyl-CoA hydrolase